MVTLIWMLLRQEHPLIAIIGFITMWMLTPSLTPFQTWPSLTNRKRVNDGIKGGKKQNSLKTVVLYITQQCLQRLRVFLFLGSVKTHGACVFSLLLCLPIFWSNHALGLKVGGGRNSNAGHQRRSRGAGQVPRGESPRLKADRTRP